MAGTLGSKQLANIIFNDAVLGITYGDQKDKLTAEQMLQAISGENGVALANFLNGIHGTNILIGSTPVSRVVIALEGQFLGRISNLTDLQAELIKLWQGYVDLGQDGQQSYANELRTWVESSGNEGQIPSLGKERKA